LDGLSVLKGDPPRGLYLIEKDFPSYAVYAMLLGYLFRNVVAPDGLKAGRLSFDPFLK